MHLRPLFTLAAALSLLTACSGDSSGTKTSQEDAPPVQTTDTTLVGKRLHLRFPENVSTVEYLSHKHLFWKSKDSVHGSKEGEDNYSVIRIGKSVFFVNWVEADGTTVSQVLDLDERPCLAPSRRSRMPITCSSTNSPRGPLLYKAYVQPLPHR